MMGRKRYKYNVDLVVEGLDVEDLDSLLKAYEDLKYFQDAVVEKMSVIKNNIIKQLSVKGWKHYKESSRGVSVTRLSKKRESVNKKTLKMILNNEQYTQVVKKESYTDLEIVTRKDRQRLDEYGDRKS
jgi:PP-loop superfamily ATP-utilizing enzyme